jgi:hypothetical protein
VRKDKRLWREALYGTGSIRGGKSAEESGSLRGKEVQARPFKDDPEVT